MNIKDTTVAVILYKSKELANGEYPLVLRITKNRKRKYKYLSISCPEKLWDAENNRPKRSHPDKRKLDSIIAKTIAGYKDQIYDLEREGKDFTADTLFQSVQKPKRKISVLDFFEEIIKRLVASRMVGNAGVYKDCKGVLKKFIGGKDITFSDIDYAFLIKFETHMRKNGNTETAMSVRFRTLRALFNKAIQENVIVESAYPFKKFKIGKFDVSTRKRAITREDIKEIEGLEIAEKSTMFEARQYFLFSYYGLGINFIDIATLKWKNVLKDRIFYKRAKTGKEINFKLLPESTEFINYWRPITGGNSENYVFPILDRTKHETPTQIDNRVQKVLKRVNKDLKQIGKDIKLETPLATGVARHTFATVLRRSGVSTAIISQAMQHKSEQITNIYLKSFENDDVDAAQGNL